MSDCYCFYSRLSSGAIWLYDPHAMAGTEWKCIKATPRVAADICAAFDIPQDGLFKTTTYRQKYVNNLLDYSSRRLSNPLPCSLQLLAESFRTAVEKMPRLKEFVKANPGATIIYVTTQKVLVAKFMKRGFRVEFLTSCTVSSKPKISLRS